MGVSQWHSSHVGIVRNLATNNISPQFHCVYDDFFETVHADDKEVPSQWDEFLTFQTTKSEYDNEDYVPELSDEWLNEMDLANCIQRRMERKSQQALPSRKGVNPTSTIDAAAPNLPFATKKPSPTREPSHAPSIEPAPDPTPCLPT